MFDEKEYQKVFSKVTASREVYRRVMTMTSNRKAKKGGWTLARAALVAAVVSLLAVTVSASETVQNWFVSFFADKTQGQLSQGQVEYIEENVQNIQNSQTQNGWTVELRSAIQDGTSAYIIFHIEGPEDVDLTAWKDEQGNVLGQVLFGNTGQMSCLSGVSSYFTFPEEIKYGNWGEKWLKDDDGLPYTVDLLFYLNPDMVRSEIDPFGSEAVYHFCFENIVWFYQNMDYYRELMDGKYAGQNGVMLTDEETERLYCYDTLAEGVWEFDITFSTSESSGEYVELLAQNVTTQAPVFRRVGGEIVDYETVVDAVTLTSVELRHLSVTFAYEDCDGVPDFWQYEEDQEVWPYVVLKDGTELALLPHGASGNGIVTMEIAQPVVFEEVDHIRLVDGTVIPMP